MPRSGAPYGSLLGQTPSTSHTSAATTPPPLTSDTRSVQTSSVASVNGDAIEGAQVVLNGHKVSVQSSEPTVYDYNH